MFAMRRSTLIVAALVLSLVAITVVPALLDRGEQGVAPAKAADTAGLTGQRLAAALDLQVVETQNDADSCEAGIAEVDGIAYCLEGAASTPTDEWKLAMSLRGHEPSDEEIRVWEANEALRGALDRGASESEINQLRKEFDSLRAECGETCASP